MVASALLLVPAFLFTPKTGAAASWDTTMTVDQDLLGTGYSLTGDLNNGLPSGSLNPSEFRYLGHRTVVADVLIGTGKQESGISYPDGSLNFEIFGPDGTLSESFQEQFKAYVTLRIGNQTVSMSAAAVSVSANEFLDYRWAADGHSVELADDETVAVTLTDTRSVPTAPANLTADPAYQQVALAWDSQGESAIWKWQYRYRNDDNAAWSQGWRDVPGSNAATTSYTVTGLTGAGYVFEVRAVDVFGGPAAAASVDMPGVTLILLPDSISENGGRATVTATLSKALTAATTVTVSAAAVKPAVAGDFTLSTNTTLTIPAEATESNGVVTITALDNAVSTPHKSVTVSGTVSGNAGAMRPSDVILAITDDELPEVTLALSPDTISENGGETTVTATLSHPSSAATTVTVSAAAVSPAVAGDVTITTNTTLTIPARATESTGV